MWDHRFQDSLKSEARNNGGAGVRTKILINRKLTNNKTIFLHCIDYNSELFLFLSTQLLSGAPNDKIVVVTDNEMVVSNHDIYLTLSWRRLLSIRNQSIHLQSKSMDWFLYDNGLRHDRVKWLRLVLRRWMFGVIYTWRSKKLCPNSYQKVLIVILW